MPQGWIQKEFYGAFPIFEDPNIFKSIYFMDKEHFLLEGIGYIPLRFRPSVLLALLLSFFLDRSQEVFGFS